MGDWELPTPSTGVDRVDVAYRRAGISGNDARIGDLLAVGRVGRMQVVHVVVVGNLSLTSPTGFDRVDVTLGVVTLQAFQARVDDPFAVGRIVGSELVLVVVGELVLCPPPTLIV